MQKSTTLAGIPPMMMIAALMAAGCGSKPEGVTNAAPAVPTGLSALAGDRQVALTWAANTESDLTYYRVLQGTVSGSLTQVNTVSPPGTALTVVNLQNGTTYFFALEAVDQFGVGSGRSAEVSATPVAPAIVAPGAPAAPTGLTHTDGDGQVALSWVANTGADLKEYRVYKGTVSGVLALAQTVNVSATSWVAPGLVNGTTYYFAVQVVDTGGRESPLSAEVACHPVAPAVNTAPATPTAFGAAPGDAHVTLTWAPNSEADLKEYRVYQGTVSGSLAVIQAVAAPATTWLASGLTNGTTYFFALQAVDTGGLASEKTAEVAANPAAPDTVKPRVTSATPASGASGVAFDTVIAVTFSEPITDLALSMTPSVDPGAPTWSAGNQTATFLPATPLTADTSYTVAVTAKDLAGNPLDPNPTLWSFRTAAAPANPTLTSSSPSAGATGVAASANLSFSFDLPMNRASVEGAVSTTPAITCAWAWSTDSTLATCAHANLTLGATYAVTLGTGAQSAAGKPLLAPTSFSFTVVPAPPPICHPVVCPGTADPSPCTQCPASVATAPAASATGVSRATNIVVEFSEPMDKASAQTAFAITAPSGHNAGVFTWNASGTVMTYNPDTDFLYGDNVTWTVSTAAKNAAGNTMNLPFTRSFRAIRSLTQTITATPGLDGYVTSTGTVNTSGTTMYVGSFTFSVLQYLERGFLSFDLGALPSTLTGITMATLKVYQQGYVGDPYGMLGTLKAEHIDYGATLDSADFSASLPSFRQCVLVCRPTCVFACLDVPYQPTLSVDATTGLKSIDVTPKVVNDWTNRVARANRCQFRLNFSDATTVIGSNYVILTTQEGGAVNAPKLEVTYEAP
jgi:fibronectin type 3 domain-containing protein